MKIYLTPNFNLSKTVVFILCVFLSFSIKAQTISNKSNPNWESDADWTAGAPTYSTIQSAFLGHDSEVSNDLLINNAITVSYLVSLAVEGYVSIGSSGHLIVNGNIEIVNGKLHIK